MAVEKIKAEIVLEIDKGSSNKAKEDAKIFARDTKKELDKATLLKLELDLAGLKLQKREASKELKDLQKQYEQGIVPRDKVIEAQRAFDSISSSTTEAQRKLQNYKNTGDETLSRFRNNFNNVTNEIKKTRQELEKAGKSTKGLDQIIIKADKLEKELKQGVISQKEYTKGMQDIEKAVKKTNDNLNGFGFSMVKLNAIIEVAQKGIQALRGVYNSWLSTLGENEQYERLFRIVNNVTGASREQVKVLNDQAKALSQVGVVSAGNITQVQSQLATFDLQIATIKTLTPAILDYVTAEKGASATTEDFKQATNGLAQALNGNFGSLTRVGFVLDENTKKQISNGTEMERAEAIVSVLNSTYGGFNQALKETPLGKIQNLGNRFDDLRDTLFDKLTPAFSSAIEVIGDFFEILEDPNDVISKYKIKVENTETLMATLQQAYIDGKISIEDYEFAIGELNKNIDGYNKKIDETGNNQNTFTRLLIDNFKSMVSTIGNFFKSFGLLFASVVTSFITGLTAIGEGVGQTIGFIQTNFSALVNNAKVIVENIGGSISKLVDEISGGIANIINSSIEGLNKLPLVNIKGRAEGTTFFKGGGTGEFQELQNNFNLKATKEFANKTESLFKQSGEAFGDAFSKGTESGVNQALEDGKKLEDILNKTKAGLNLDDVDGGGGGGGGGSSRVKNEEKTQEELDKIKGQAINKEIEQNKKFDKFLEDREKKRNDKQKDLLKGLEEGYKNVAKVYDESIKSSEKRTKEFEDAIKKLVTEIAKIDDELSKLDEGRAKTLGTRNVEIDKELEKLRAEEIIDIQAINKLLEEKRLIEANATKQELDEAKRIADLSPTARFLEEFEQKKLALEEDRQLKKQELADLEEQKEQERIIFENLTNEKIALEERYQDIVEKIESEITDKIAIESRKRIDLLKQVQRQAEATARALSSAGMGGSSNTGSSNTSNTINNSPTVVVNANVSSDIDVNNLGNQLANKIILSSKGIN